MCMPILWSFCTQLTIFRKCICCSYVGKNSLSISFVLVMGIFPTLNVWYMIFLSFVRSVKVLIIPYVFVMLYWYLLNKSLLFGFSLTTIMHIVRYFRLAGWGFDLLCFLCSLFNVLDEVISPHDGCCGAGNAHSFWQTWLYSMWELVHPLIVFTVHNVSVLGLC